MNTDLNLSTAPRTTSTTVATMLRRATPSLFTAGLMTLGLLLFCTPASAQEDDEDAFTIQLRAWEERNRSEDISAQKRSDALRDVERLYDPSTGEVYQFDNGFSDSYEVNKNEYRMNDLEQLPDNNYDLWMSAPRDGEEEVE